MTDTTSPTGTASTSSDVRLTQVEATLNALELKLKREARLTLIVAMIVLALLTGYFWYGYQQFNALLQPQELVNVAASLLDENIQPAREGIQAEIEKQAPLLAQNLSTQALDAIPNLKESLEEYIVTQSKQAVDQAIGDSTGRFDGILEQHRPEIQSLIAEMKDNDKASDEVLSALETAINEEIGQDMQANAGEVLDTLNLLTYRVERLAAGRGLNEEEQLERQALMIIRRLQLEQADPDLAIQGELSRPIVSETSEASGNGSSETTEAAKPPESQAPQTETPEPETTRREDAPNEAEKNDTPAPAESPAPADGVE